MKPPRRGSGVAMIPVLMVAPILLSVLCWRPPPAMAERPQLAVRFQITVPDYVDSFEAAVLESIAASITDSLVVLLQGNIGFSDFAAAGAGSDTTAGSIAADSLVTDTPVADNFVTETLSVELTNELPDISGGLQAVLFRIALEPNSSQQRSLTWPFLSAEVAHFEIPRIDELASGIRLHLSDPDLHAAIARKLLRHVSITELAQFVNNGPTNLLWIIPFQREELCIDTSSILSFKCDISSGPGFVTEHDLEAEANGVVLMSSQIQPLPEFLPYVNRERVYCTVSSHRHRPEVLAALVQADPLTIKVKAVYVTEYQKNESTCNIVSPADVDFSSTGGGQ